MSHIHCKLTGSSDPRHPWITAQGHVANRHLPGRCSFTSKDPRGARDKDEAERHRPLLSPLKAADLLGMSVSTLYRMVERQEIGFYRISGSLRFSEDDVHTYLASRRVAPRS